MDATKQKSGMNASYRVRDPLGILGAVVLAIVFLIGCAYANTLFVNTFFGKLDTLFGQSISETLRSPLTPLILLVNIPLLGVLYRLKAIWNGVNLELNERTMEFPGGSISANNFIDYFTPSFLLQYFRREKIDLDQISMISTDIKFGTIFKPDSADVSGYGVKFVGGFGAATAWFKSQGKRDEIYSAIRQLNNMGEPIVRA